MVRSLAAFVLAIVLANCAPPVDAPGDAPESVEPFLSPGVVDPACTENGCLRAITDLGTFTRADIEPFLSPGVEITNGYRILTVEYATGSRSSTATITLPVDLRDETLASPDGFHVVVNAHGTVGLDDACRVSSTISGTGLAGLFGARGAIGVAPDYPGLGTPGLHAYLDRQSEGESVLDAVRAALLVARHEDVAASGRAAIVGLSQGGHAVLAAASLHEAYAPELDIRAFGATAPANVYEEQWRPGATLEGAHLSMFAMLAYSFAAQSAVDDDAVWADGLRDDVDALMQERCEWSPSFTAEPLLGDAISDVPSEVFSATFLSAFSTGSWGADFAFMAERFAANRVVPFAPTAPIRIWQGTADAVVLPAMTRALVDDLNAGGMDVQLTEVEGGTHIDTAFGFLAFEERATDESVAWIQAHLSGSVSGL